MSRVDAPTVPARQTARSTNELRDASVLYGGLAVAAVLALGIPTGTARGVAAGTVTGYMAGLWAIPFLAVVLAARAVARSSGARAGLVAGTALGSLLFVGSEATSWLLGAWEAIGVKALAHVALYVVPAEVLLSASIIVADRLTRDRQAGWGLAAGWLVMQLYTGGLVLGWFALEG